MGWSVGRGDGMVSKMGRRDGQQDGGDVTVSRTGRGDG